MLITNSALSGSSERAMSVPVDSIPKELGYDGHRSFQGNFREGRSHNAEDASLY